MQESLLALLESHSTLAFIGAFGAGAITALAPCSLISVPLLVASSLSLNKDLQGARKVFYTYLFTFLFALGVMLSFSVLGFIVAKFNGFYSVAPMWAYVSSALLSMLIGFYALGLLGEFNKSVFIEKLIRFRLFGAFLIGIIFGLVSTPCASAPLVSIISVAANSGYIYAYSIILVFALGHSLLLLLAGVSVGFAQKISSNLHIARASNLINKTFALLLIGFGFYFFYKAYLQMEFS